MPPLNFSNYINRRKNSIQSKSTEQIKNMLFSYCILMETHRCACLFALKVYQIVVSLTSMIVALRSYKGLRKLNDMDDFISLQ